MSSSATTAFGGGPSAPLVKDKKKLAGAKAAAAGQPFAAAVKKTATLGLAAVPRNTSTPEMGAALSTPSSSAAATPAEPEQHVDGDVVESVMRKLKGTRPDLLRTSTYYEGAKVGSVYSGRRGGKGGRLWLIKVWGRTAAARWWWWWWRRCISDGWWSLRCRRIGTGERDVFRTMSAFVNISQAASVPELFDSSS